MEVVHRNGEKHTCNRNKLLQLIMHAYLTMSYSLWRYSKIQEWEFTKVI